MELQAVPGMQSLLIKWECGWCHFLGKSVTALFVEKQNLKILGKFQQGEKVSYIDLVNLKFMFTSMETIICCTRILRGSSVKNNLHIAELKWETWEITRPLAKGSHTLKHVNLPLGLLLLYLPIILFNDASAHLLRPEDSAVNKK